jgi:hypothetical protein
MVVLFVRRIPNLDLENVDEASQKKFETAL